MSWRRRRLRRARRRNIESTPQPVARTEQDPQTATQLIRRLVVFVPRKPRAIPTPASEPLGEPQAAPSAA